MASWDAREEENLDKKTAADYLKSQATSQARAMLLENLKSNGPGLIGDAGNALTWGDPAPAVAVAPKASADAQAAAPAALAERRRIAELEKKLAEASSPPPPPPAAATRRANDEIEALVARNAPIARTEKPRGRVIGPCAIMIIRHGPTHGLINTPSKRTLSKANAAERRVLL